MYTVSTTREHPARRRSRARDAASDERPARHLVPPQEHGHPLNNAQIRTLRSDVGFQQWLDPLMAQMKAAGNDTRMRILYLLWRRGEIRVNDLAEILDLSAPAISQQLKKLRSCDIVQARRDAQTTYYRLNLDSDFVLCLLSFFDAERQ